MAVADDVTTSIVTRRLYQRPALRACRVSSRRGRLRKVHRRAAYAAGAFALLHSGAAAAHIGGAALTGNVVEEYMV